MRLIFGQGTCYSPIADVFLGEMVMLKQRGVDCVCRFSSHRSADFRRGRRLGKGDHLVKWMKPTMLRFVDLQTYKSRPDFLITRETLVRIEQPVFAPSR